jgi:hypothetical protein
MKSRLATIEKSESPLSGVNPEGKYGYLDKVDLWLRQPISDSEFRRLKALCGHVHGTYHTNKLFYPDYHFRLSITRPPQEALALLGKLQSPRLSVVEVALDLTFKVDNERELAREAIDKYFVKRNHRSRDRYVEGTRYSGERWDSKIVVAIYDDRPSKFTGEINCVHIEWRMYGAEVLRRAGLETPNDLSDLNFHEFWKNRLLFFVPDHDKFGRKYFNERLNSRRRSAWIEQFPTSRGTIKYDHDRRMSHLILRSRGSMQAVWDEYGKRWGRLRSYVNQILVEDLLPKTLIENKQV